MNRWVQQTILVLIIGILPLATRASGYRPPFDCAIKEAELVVQGNVVEVQDTESLGRGPRSYRIEVTKSFKGSSEAGQDLVFWDPHYHSTASFRIGESGMGIFYLVPATLTEFEQKQLNSGGRKFYRPIRVRGKSSKISLAYYVRELRLLDLFVENPPENKREVYREILANENDRQLLRLIAKDWPEPLMEEDVALFRQILLNGSENSSFAFYILDKLRGVPDVFSGQEILRLLEKGGGEALSGLRPFITLGNIDLCKSLLFSWIDAEYAGTASLHSVTISIEVLARLAPGYFKAQLETHDLPFWKLIPCLGALGINGSDIGKEDHREELLSLDMSCLRGMDRLLDGDLSFAKKVLESPQHFPGCEDALPFLEPLLAGDDTPSRRLAVALFRTLGVPVERIGDGYVARYDNAPAPCPVELELKEIKSVFVQGEPVRFTLKECATSSGPYISFRGRTIFFFRYEGRSTSWIGGFDQGMWDNVVLPKEEFVELKEGMVEENEQTFPADRFRKPGNYRISVRKCYTHDGGSIGIDAWTGMAFSDQTITIKVVESLGSSK